MQLAILSTYTLKKCYVYYSKTYFILSDKGYLKQSFWIIRSELFDMRVLEFVIKLEQCVHVSVLFSI